MPIMCQAIQDTRDTTVNKIGWVRAPSDLQLPQPGNLVLDISQVLCDPFEGTPNPTPENPGEDLPLAHCHDFKWGKRETLIFWHLSFQVPLHELTDK